MRELGVDAYLTKPLKQSCLFESLATVLGHAQAQPISPGLAPLAPQDPREAAGAAAQDLRVLVVEDNPVNQKVALHQLQKLGYLADAAENGVLALEAIRRGAYDLIFMDCQMPLLDGYETTRELRRIEGSERHTWVVAMTAHSLQGDRAKCLAAGMDDYISKPVKMEDLGAALGRLRGMREATEEALVTDAAAIIDRTALEGFRELEGEAGENILEKLVDLFLENTPSVLREAHAALNAQMSPQLARAAHTLKGSCSNFGAERMRDACLQLEQAANQDAFGNAAESLAQVEREFHCVRLALERELTRDAA
jgi:CheY-like chemotaxis protein/HPt (histidine-containing phosphotransfer) domain-containing protein